MVKLIGQLLKWKNTFLSRKVEQDYSIWLPSKKVNKKDMIFSLADKNQYF